MPYYYSLTKWCRGGKHKKNGNVVHIRQSSASQPTAPGFAKLEDSHEEYRTNPHPARHAGKRQTRKQKETEERIRLLNKGSNTSQRRAIFIARKLDGCRGTSSCAWHVFSSARFGLGRERSRGLKGILPLFFIILSVRQL